MIRRSISLISVDRAEPANMIMVRRELPRTSGVSLSRSSWHIGRSRFLRTARHRPLSARLQHCTVGLLRRVLPFGLNSHRPDEAEKLASYCGDGGIVALAAPLQSSVALVEAVLRLPGNRFDLLAQSFLPLV